MNSNAEILYPYYELLYNKLINNDFVIDKTNVKLVELIAPRIELNPLDLYIDFKCRKSPRKYIEKEKQWYLSKDLNIKQVNDVDIWNKVSDKNNEINSNYGYLVYGRGNFNQFDNALQSLIKNKYSRQSIIIYTRPSIHYEFDSFDCGDFICTSYQQFIIRDNKLICITSMRSNDAIFGTFNDIPWFHEVILDMYNKLKEIYNDIELGHHIFIPNSWHVYERHFELLKNIYLKK